MPIYAMHEVRFIWLVDPDDKTLEVYRLESGKWLMLAAFAEDGGARAEPFQEIEIDLGNLWLE
jgi:hypothetical protein